MKKRIQVTLEEDERRALRALAFLEGHGSIRGLIKQLAAEASAEPAVQSLLAIQAECKPTKTERHLQLVHSV